MNSLVDIREVFLDLELIQGTKAQVQNPLGADFDLADIFIENEKYCLECSPFIHAWSEKTEQIYSKKIGIWLSASNESLFLNIEFGSSKIAVEYLDTALFFEIPDNLLSTEKKLRLVVTCMN